MRPEYNCVPLHYPAGDSALDVHVSFYVDDINSISSRDMVRMAADAAVIQRLTTAMFGEALTRIKFLFLLFLTGVSDGLLHDAKVEDG